jgi:hypothetical protein
MENWSIIINTVLLGTAKKELRQADIDPALTDIFEAVTANSKNKEEHFLQVAALHLAYRRCGFQPLKKENVTILKAENEEKQYAGKSAHQVLSDILETGSISLLQLWLRQCNKAQKIVQPEWLPLLMDTSTRHKMLLPLIKLCYGKRGAWLVQWNNQWVAEKNINREEVWETGSLEQRKDYLSALRKTDPAEALVILQQIWQQESAAARAALLQPLKVGLSASDLPFLEPLLQDKSNKVKEAALELLKAIPDSSVVQLYWNQLKSSIGVVKEKVLLGLSKKTVFYLHGLQQPDEALFKTGIEKISSDKGVPDDLFISLQLLAAVPPGYVDEHLQLPKEEVVKLVTQHERSRELIHLLTMAAIRFKDVAWLKALLALEESGFHPEAFQLLSQKEMEQFIMPHLHLDDMARQIIPYLVELEEEWSMELSRAVLKHTAKAHYNYNIGFYRQIIHLLPVSIIGELEKYTPKEEYQRSFWSDVSIQLTHMLTLKLQTFNAFND